LDGVVFDKLTFCHLFMEFPPVMEIERPLHLLVSLSLPFLQAR